MLFDMGGVVLSVDFKDIFKAWAKLSTLDESNFLSRFSLDEKYQQHERGTIDAAAFFQYQRDMYALEGTDSEIIAGWNAIFGAEITQSLDAIDAISGSIPCYGFTNTNRTHQVYWEAKFPRMHSTFEKLFVSSEIGLRKPDAEAFYYVLNEISVDPEELLFFDDSVENVEGASVLGIQTVLVTGPAAVLDALKQFH